MRYAFAEPSKHMVTLQRLVTAKVTTTLVDSSKTRSNLIFRLRRIQNAAYKFGADRQTMQVITSGRRLLGDRLDLTPDPVRRIPTSNWLR